MVARPGGVVDRSVELAAVIAHVDPPFDQLLEGGDGMLVRTRQRDDEARALAGFLELARCAFGDDAPMVDHDDLVGQRVGFFQVLGGQQYGDAFAHEFPDDVPDPLAAGGVEPGRRFVEEQHGGPWS